MPAGGRGVCVWARAGTGSVARTLVRLPGGVESTTSLRKATILQCRERVIQTEQSWSQSSISKLLLTDVAAVPVLLTDKWLFPVATSGRSPGVG